MRVLLERPRSAPEGLGRQDLQVLLMHVLGAGGTGAQGDASMEHPLEKIRLLARRVELGLAVRPRADFELDPARTDATGDARDELPVTAVEPVGDAEDHGEVLDGR